MSSCQNNSIQKLLLDLGICNLDSINKFYPKVRDRDDISVMRCQKSGVIFLSSSSHIQQSYYSNKTDLSYWSASSRQQAVLGSFEDDSRRANQFEAAIKNKKWLDYGTGVGGILDLLNHKASQTLAVEPQAGIREQLIKCGYKVHDEIENVKETDLDVVTLFHVYEHLINPIEIGSKIREKLKIGGKIIVEVPHAKDFLIDFLNLETFKAFTFWSEHLILHTRTSLEIFLQESGFKNIVIKGFQRYPLANHLYWLSKGKPGGHQHWHYLRTKELDKDYADMLASLDKTDTLIAIAEK